MSNRRIVEDSDGEENLDDSPAKEACEAPAQTPSSNTTIALNYSDSSQQKRDSASVGPSTGSTEQLNRDINEAYNILLEPSTSRSTHSSYPSTGSPSQFAKRATVDFGKGVVKTPKITYGARKDRSTHLDSDDDDSPRPRKRGRKSSGTGRDAKDNYKDDNENLTSSGALNGQGTLNGNGGSINDLLAEKSKKEADHKDSSSGQPMLPPPPRSSGTASTIPFTDPPSRPSRHYDLGCGSPGKNQSAGFDGLETSTSTPAQRKTRKRAASELESPKITLGEEIAPSSSAPAESPIKRARRNRSQPNQASFISPTKSASGHDELSLSVASSPASIRKTNTSEEKPSRQSRPASEAPEDDLPDIPAETYKARPSRSRSARSTDDLLIPTDFSKRPEALAKPKGKGKRKRRRTDTSEQTWNEDPIVQPDDITKPNPPARTEDNTAQDEHTAVNE
ncbi:MAG: hypothetical protein Q9183_005828, partial [Haloplaca sp. 2 TL-2023]